jgi:5-oxoprolinase (ATP-hydrolysing)
VAVAHVAAQGGFASAVGLDMGGTSTDVCRVEHGRLPFREGTLQVGGVWIRRPMLEVHTIAAGGGSILQNDGVRLGVGPASAGADPGPACYGRGGPQTLTDAALEAGLLDPTAFDPPLELGAVDLPGDAREFLDLAREAMAAAVRRIATRRGIDLRDDALVAYGGAAGQHAAPVAERLGIRTVLIHPCAAVLCAWGQALARREEEAVRPLWRLLPQCADAVHRAWAELEATLPALGEVQTFIDLRHQGTDHAIAVQAGDCDEAVRLFLAAHEARFGFRRPAQAIEVVRVRVRVRAEAPRVPQVDADPWGLGDQVCDGPVRIDGANTSIWVPTGWRAQRRDGLLRLDHLDAPERTRPMERSPYGVELWGRRFMAVAEQAGELLQRQARSANIKERLDFSCAIFDGHGYLVANAPHVPVHLGAMGETVRDLLRSVPAPADGQCWLSNDPAAGGSHLPDLTVVTSVRRGGQQWFVASRAHHVDVGGLTPGSMPPHSRTLADEGVCLRQVALLQAGRLVDLRPLLRGCRQPDTVIADIEAQIAANRHAASALEGLGSPIVITRWMAILQDAAAEAAEAMFVRLQPGRASGLVDGVPLEVAMAVVDGKLVVDFSGTGGPHSGNLNAPAAVVQAAVLYTVRLLIGTDIPLNDGAVRGVRLVVPAGSILSPPPDSAVVGGNVETSQHLVDLLLAAAGHQAASQGTMNNLTLGGGSGDACWSVYETVGGGGGAGAHCHGAAGRQVHMTNTAATDPEVLEARFPLRVRRFSLRPGSGGGGQFRGGDGLIREIEVLQACEASLLVARRPGGAPGLHGGEAGAPGRYALQRQGHWRDWDGQTVTLSTGDRVRIETPGGGGWGRP